MKYFKPRMIFPVLAFTLVTACSNSDDLSSSTPSENEVASQSSENKTERKTESVKVETSDNVLGDVITTSRTADSHSHGDAQLAIVLENGVVTIEFDSPLYNILGFEHAPETEAQKDTLKRAENQLERGSELFTFNSEAKCPAAYETQKVTLFNMDEHDDHKNHDDHDDHDTHKDEHDEATHRDVLLSYEFRCQNPTSLSNISVNLFEFFTELTEIDVTYLGPSVQKQVSLSPNNSKMEISQ